jgi:hypothetical protein
MVNQEVKASAKQDNLTNHQTINTVKASVKQDSITNHDKINTVKASAKQFNSNSNSTNKTNDISVISSGELDNSLVSSSYYVSSNFDNFENQQHLKSTTDIDFEPSSNDTSKKDQNI